MIWVRKGIVHLLALLLLISLVYGAFAVSANVNLSHPQKLETWLGQSNFYDSVVNNVLDIAQKSASNDVGAGRVSLSDPLVRQTVKSVFSPQLLKQYTDTLLTSNYAWLEGKTSSPQFTIDLTSAKQKLAQQVGAAVQAHVASLPTCSSAQLAQLQTTLNTDPLSIPCLLPGLTPQIAAAQASAQITGSSNFLNNPVITANALNPNGSNQGRPYYQKLSSAPKLYRWGIKLPWIFGGLALLSTIGIVFIAPRKRKGVRRVGVVLLLAGVILVAVKFAADTVFNWLEKRLYSHSSIGQLQQSLTDFLHRLETQLVKVDFWFGIAFLVLAVLLLATLWFTRQKAGGASTPGTPGNTPNDDITDESDKPPLPVLKQPPQPKRPRLIQ